MQELIIQRRSCCEVHAFLRDGVLVHNDGSVWTAFLDASCLDGYSTALSAAILFQTGCRPT